MSKRINDAFPAFGGYRTIVSDIPNIHTIRVYTKKNSCSWTWDRLNQKQGKDSSPSSLVFEIVPQPSPSLSPRLQDTFTLYRSKGVETCRTWVFGQFCKVHGVAILFWPLNWLSLGPGPPTATVPQGEFPINHLHGKRVEKHQANAIQASKQNRQNNPPKTTTTTTITTHHRLVLLE